MAKYRVIVAGPRAWADRSRVHDELDALLARCEARGDLLVVVNGMAPRGVDLWAHGWYLSRWHELPARAVREEPHRADWDRHLKRAGFIRNQAMADAGADECLAFVLPCSGARCSAKPRHLTHGTADMIERCEKAGIPVRKVTGDGT